MAHLFGSMCELSVVRSALNRAKTREKKTQQRVNIILIKLDFFAMQKFRTLNDRDADKHNSCVFLAFPH